jgi:hypothetical protein
MQDQSEFEGELPPAIDPDVFSQESEEERRQAHFRDYLLAPRIGGRSPSHANQTRIRAEDVTNTGERVEIANVRTDEESESHNHKGGVVSVERDENGDISSILVECTCGDKIVLKFDELEDHLQSDETQDQEIIADQKLDGGDVDGRRITRGEVDPDKLIN